MRTAFINALVSAARERPEVFLVVGDLGFSVVEAFADEFPDRFLNAGVAEQNMTGVAAGLASEGYHVFTYSIANFPTLRCYEQIRNDVCYHKLPVTVVAVGGGVAYGNLGYSHHGIQDLAVMRSLPGMCVIAPADPGETRCAVNLLLENPGPSYLRLGKAGEPELHERGGLLGNSPILVSGDSEAAVAFLATGSILKEAIEASSVCAKAGMDVAVYSVPVLKPIATKSWQALSNHQKLVVVEEHVSVGGLGDLVRSSLPGIPVFHRCLSDATGSLVGSEAWIREQESLTGADLAQIALG